MKSVWFASTMTATPTQVGQLEIESINWGSQWPTYDRHPTFFFFSFFFFLLLSSVFSFPSHSPLLRRFFPRADRIWLDSTGGEWNESPRRFSDRFFAPLDRLLPNSVDKRVSSGRRREHSSTFYRRVFIRPRCTQRTSNRARVEMKEKRNK